MPEAYTQIKHIQDLPSLPLQGHIDLTYRCNNNCRHCWIRIPANSNKIKEELSFNEIKKIVEEAKQLGCRRWDISGGEPMLRPDFAEIFDYVTRNSSYYFLNTNGTFITPKIAKLMTREGINNIALYGATAKVHDYITRNPGSFEKTMRGISYLKEANAKFFVSIVPMKDNFHQFLKMRKLAQSLSSDWRQGSDWLFLSAGGDVKLNKEIIRQRISPELVVKSIMRPTASYFDIPDKLCDDSIAMDKKTEQGYLNKGKCLFHDCIISRHEFYIDPYGFMTFCDKIVDKTLRYDLRKGSIKKYWDKFIPSIMDKVKAGKEYFENCGSCKLNNYCLWCPVFGYLEHRRYGAKVEYLCKIAKEYKKFQDSWGKKHCRYYMIAGIVIRVESDLPITDKTFHASLKLFEVKNPGKCDIVIRHHFSLPAFAKNDLGKFILRKRNRYIYKRCGLYIYLQKSNEKEGKKVTQLAIFNDDHTRGRVYNYSKDFIKGNHRSLCFYLPDKISIDRVLADRQGCYFHSSGISFNGNGFLFLGHSGAGKTTIFKMFKGKAKLLSEDQIVVRRHPNGYKICGVWGYSKGYKEEPSETCADTEPLKAIFFLEKSKNNKIELIKDKREIDKRLLAFLIKPLDTEDWWEKMVLLVDNISNEIPCYMLYFDKSGRIIDLIAGLKVKYYL